jgi:chromate reductase, NAD(P)H dehydrogenase (quinone)
MKFLAISGSLRSASSNTLLVEALHSLCPVGVEIVVYRHLGALPHFNPDLDGEALPEPVRVLRRCIGATDGLIICSPEYAHGVAGVMKNALDWLVPSLEFPGTAVALINASPRARYAIAHMRETLVTMQARIVEQASITIPLQGRQLLASDIIEDPALAGPIRTALVAFAEAVGAMRSAVG